MNTRHTPVLLQEVLEVLNIQETNVVLDGTLGGGGHATAFVEQLGDKGYFVGFDADSSAVTRVRERLTGANAHVTLINDNFRNVATRLHEAKIHSVDKAFFDLGWSSDQLEDSGRGFSFTRDEPLQMTLQDNPGEGVVTAYDVVNDWEEQSLADVIYGWGGERFARRIARAIVRAREEEPIVRTTQLADIVSHAVPAPLRHGKRHPATKTFQAIRIAVNDELGALKDLLDSLPALANENAIVAFLTFHSLEDKLVKETFRTWAQEGRGEIITKKPITPSQTEVGQNPRSRSAKLRAFTFTHYATSKKE